MALPVRLARDANIAFTLRGEPFNLAVQAADLGQGRNAVSQVEAAAQHVVAPARRDIRYRLGVKQKLMAARGENKAYKLKGSVQIDDAYIGGERKGPSGRGAEGKTPFLAAVETRDGKPVYIKLRLVQGFTNEAVESYAQEALEPGFHVISDGLACFASLTKAATRRSREAGPRAALSIQGSNG